MPGRILIVDDVATNRIVMKVKLSAARYEVVAACDAREGIRVAAEGGIDLIVMDMMMPGMSGAEACRRLRGDPATASIPIILITAMDDPEARVEALDAGADDFLSKPIDEVALLARVRSLLRRRDEERSLEAHGFPLMEVSYDAPLDRPTALAGGFAEAGGPSPFAGPGELGERTSEATARIALLWDVGVSWPSNVDSTLRRQFPGRVKPLFREEALMLAPADAPDVMLIRADVEGGDGLRLMSELRSRAATRHCAFVVALPEGDSERAATALDLGASDVVYLPFPPDELAIRLRTQVARKLRGDRMRATLERGLQLAVIDPLTGLHNRRYGLHHLDRVAARCRAQGVHAGVILIDIDHFKQVNDTHGHPVGDLVLARVAQRLKESLRGQDFVARIGGEEFLAVLPETGLSHVRAVAERLRRSIEDLRIPLKEPVDGTGDLSVTLSLGIAMLEDREDSATHVLTRVDRALYSAKRSGRNVIVLADEVDPG